MKRLRSKHIKIARENGGLKLSFEPTIELTYGSKPHASIMLRRVKRLMKGQGWVTQRQNGGIVAFVSPNFARVREALEALDQLIEKISDRTLEPREVEALLSISSKERVRWTKDRRLPTEGRGSFRRGDKISYSTYSARKILKLSRNQKLIADWRAADQDGENSKRNG